MKSLVLAAVLLATPALAFAQDLTGAWTVSSSVGATPITVACDLTQKGELLTGTCTPAGGTAGPGFTGSVKGTHASWGYDVPFRGQVSHVGFDAEASSDAAMKGTLTLGTRPSPFTAVKK
jgi:hypothetical protein